MSAGKSRAVIRAGLGLIKIYVVVAFVFWKWSCYYITGRNDQFFFSPDHSPWSLAVGMGYVLGVIFLLANVVWQMKLRQYAKVTSLLLFASLGLLFLYLGTAFSNPTINTMGMRINLGFNLLLLYFSFLGWRHFSRRIFTYWCLAYAIILSSLLVYLFCASDSIEQWPNPGNFYFWVSRFHGPEINLWFAERPHLFYWLIFMVPNILLTVGFVLLVRRVRGIEPRVPITSTIIYLALGFLVVWLNIGYSSPLQISPAFAMACVANIVMFGSALTVCRRPNCFGFVLWAWASFLALAVLIAGRYYPFWVSEFRTVTPLLPKLMVSGAWFGEALRIVGLIVMLRQLNRPIEPVRPNAAPVAEVNLLPHSLAWMRKRLAMFIIFDGLVACLIWGWLHDFSLEPRYEGQSLTYWLEHWYSNAGGNPESRAAVKTMGAKTLPYLVDWICRPFNSYPGVNYPDCALAAFTVLGPDAQPALPKLIKRIGQGSYVMRAIECIGPTATPALADKYVELLSQTNSPRLNWRDPRYRTSPVCIRECILEVLAEMGTNAEAAVPALIQGAHSPDPSIRESAIIVLGNVGQNQPAKTLPALLNLFTNSDQSDRALAAEALAAPGKQVPAQVIPTLVEALTNEPVILPMIGSASLTLAVISHDQPYVAVPVLIQVLDRLNRNPGSEEFPRYNIVYYRLAPALPYDYTGRPQAVVADALATFGEAARTAIPSLMVATQSTNATVRAHAAVALKAIEPEVTGTLAPLWRNLQDRNSQIRQNALSMLQGFGTNAAEAIPALTEASTNDPDPNLRRQAIDCIAHIGAPDEAAISAISQNLDSTNSSVSESAIEALSAFAGRKQSAFIALLRVWAHAPDRSTRDNLRFQLEQIVQKNSSTLVDCLTNHNPQIRYSAMLFLSLVGLDIPNARPAIVDALYDENFETRLLATNILKDIGRANRNL